MGKHASWMPSFQGLAKSLVLDNGFYSLDGCSVIKVNDSTFRLADVQ